MNSQALTHPSIEGARLPALYSAARSALEKCSRIDECKDWADKAEALASYAKQADDKALQDFAVRVRARAIRKCGELLKEIEPQPGKRNDLQPSIGADTRSVTARKAGLSKGKKDTALRVASVSVQEFEAAVESDNPPTVTELADRGKKTSTAHLKGRAPKDFAASTQIQGQLRYFAEDIAAWDIDAGLRGAFDDDIVELRFNAAVIIKRLTSLIAKIDLKGARVEIRQGHRASKL